MNHYDFEDESEMNQQHRANIVGEIAVMVRFK